MQDLEYHFYDFTLSNQHYVNIDEPFLALLGGSWVAIGGVISPLIWVIIIVYLTYNPTCNYP